MTAAATGAGLRVFALFAAGYVLSYALRTVNAVIAPDLVEQFGISNATLGALSSVYFFSFIVMQLPLGVWLDRFGSRDTDAMLLAVAAIGCLMFALATDAWTLGVARVVIGIGVSGALMSALRAFRFEFAPERQQRLSAWILTVGTMGAIAATVPAQLALPLYGWRGLFVLCAVLLALSAAALRGLLPNEPRQPQTPLAEQWRGYAEVFRERYFWRFVLSSITLQATFIAMQSLWAGPWFIQVLGLSPAQSAQALLALNVVLMFSYLLLGWAMPRLVARGWSIRAVTATGSALMLAAQAAIVIAEGAWAWLVWLPYAVGVTVFTPAQTHVSLTFRGALTGRAFSAFNLMIFVGIFFTQWLFGVLVDALGAGFGLDQPAAFRVALAVSVGLQGLALAVMVGWRVEPPGGQGATRPAARVR